MSGAVLALRPRALGDVVLVTAALRALKRGYPERDLEVVTEPRFAPLIEGLEEVSRVWPIGPGGLSSLELIRALRRRRVELAVDFFGNPRTALVTAACGARRTAGYDLRARRRSYSIRVPRSLTWPGPEGARREYAAATHVRLAEAAGGKSDGLASRVSIPTAAEAAATDLLRAAGVADAGGTVGLVPAGTWPSKTWPLANAALLARRLMAAGREVLVLSGPGEDEETRRLLELAKGLRALPRSGVAELAAVIARLGAVVGTDSGPIHLAASFGVPTFAWFGPTHPDTWSPPGERHAHWWTGLPCRGCDRTVCPHWSCLPSLSADHAAERVREHLERHVRSTPALGPAAGA